MHADLTLHPRRVDAADVPDFGSSSLVRPIAEALVRLDQRRHVTPARMELSWVDREWVAQLIADPLRRAVVGAGTTPVLAIGRLVEAVENLDWRRVAR